MLLPDIDQPSKPESCLFELKMDLDKIMQERQQHLDMADQLEQLVFFDPDLADPEGLGQIDFHSNQAVDCLAQAAFFCLNAAEINRVPLA
jgi:hypothetical protein